jgi:hypothetical protein
MKILQTFGFQQYDAPDSGYFSIYLNLDDKQAIAVDGFDYMAQASISCPEYYGQSNISVIGKDSENYSLDYIQEGQDCSIVLSDEAGLAYASFDVSQIFSRFEAYSADKSVISPEEATFTAQGEKASMTVVAQNVSITGYGKDQTQSGTDGDKYQSAQIYIFISFNY